jgi:hypothetical protein
LRASADTLQPVLSQEVDDALSPYRDQIQAKAYHHAALLLHLEGPLKFSRLPLIAQVPWQLLESLHQAPRIDDRLNHQNAKMKSEQTDADQEADEDPEVAANYPESPIVALSSKSGNAVKS